MYRFKNCTTYIIIVKHKNNHAFYIILALIVIKICCA